MSKMILLVEANLWKYLIMASISMAKAQKSRYKVLEQVGSGDFAKVYAAEDTKLGRKVAIKQLHRQYIDDEKKLSRYWREAQLLVDLEHPNIMTIYDVVKARGCLVLELMQGSLKQVYGNKPMPVSDVRETIIEVCKGLECLHNNGIIHGDIKPANLMLSRQNVVKLGDFGLARRANDDEGSLVKGTTKYMAPELVSEEFGEVGPQSDLYSLGFSALELLVGPEFDSLFPDLIAFGRDPQMAWMMWHCSADRRFPPIQTVLKGVPDDLANVLNRLTTKDPTKRYKTAREVILDLKSGAKPVGESINEEELRLAEIARKEKNKRRKLAAVICFASLCLSGILLWATREIPEPPAFVPPAPLHGVVENVLDRDNKFVMDVGGSDWKEFTLRNHDAVILNRKERQLRDLEPKDRVVVNYRVSDEGRKWLEIVAFRPEHHAGTITSVNLEDGTVHLSVADGEDEGKQFDLKITEETKIVINKKEATEEAPFTIDSLAENDIVEVDLSDATTGMLALKVDALRRVGIEGVIRKLEPRKGTMTIAKTSGSEEELAELLLDEKCVITLNGVKSIDERLLNAMDIKIGDRVSVQHDVKITSIDAYRPFEDIGRIQSIEYGSNQFLLKSQAATGSITYKIGNKTQILLGGEQVTLEELRPADNVQLVHDMPDAESPTILSLNAERPIDRKKWAILIGNEQFDSAELPELKTPIANIASMKADLMNRYGVPESQIKVFENEGRVRLEQELPRTFDRLSASSELYVYVATRGFADDESRAYLATKDLDPTNMRDTGFELEWLIDAMDDATASKKILLLDCWTDTKVPDSVQTTTEDMVSAVKSTRRGGYPRFTYVLTNTGPGQKALTSDEDPSRSVFGQAVAEGFSGKADKERDTKVEVTELAKYVSLRVASLAKSQNARQTTYLYTPDNSPPRLTDANQDQIMELLSKFGTDYAADALPEAQRVSQLCNGEPEPLLAAGLMLTKTGQIPEALRVLEEVRLKHRAKLLAHQSVIWIHFYKRHYDTGASKLVEMVQAIPVPEKDNVLSESVLEKIEWVGQLRELAAGSSSWNKRIPGSSTLQSCDSAVAGLGKAAVARYEAGRKVVAKQIAAFEAQVAADPNGPAFLNRKKIQSYIPPIASTNSIQEIKDGLND